MMSREEMHRQKQQADASVKQPRHHHFGADELADSPISTQLQEEVNGSLSEYGVSGSLLTT